MKTVDIPRMEPITGPAIQVWGSCGPGPVAAEAVSDEEEEVLVREESAVAVAVCSAAEVVDAITSC